MKKVLMYSLAIAALGSSSAWAADPVGAQIVAKNLAPIGAPMSGTIDNLPIDDGTHFDEGSVLVGFQCAQQNAALAHARAQEVKARGILSVQLQLRQLGSYSALELRNAQADVQVSAAEVALAQANIQNCTVKAPFSGRVSGMSVHNHQYVQAGAALFEILSDKGLEVEMIVPSDWLSWLKTDSPFKVGISENKKSYSGHLVRVSGKVDPVSRTIKVYGVIDGEPDTTLLPGMSGHVEFQNAAK